MYYLIADLKVWMSPQYKPLIDQIEPYKITYTPSSLDCQIPQNDEVIKRYQEKNPHLTMGEAEYLLYGAYFYDSLLHHQGIFLHSSCVVYQGYAYLFSANSGIGKSTHTSIWKKVFKDAFILNDDKPALKFDDDILYAYGTPFSGKTNQNVNTKAKVAGIAFIYRSEINESKEMTSKETIVQFIAQTMKPHKEESFHLMAKTLDRIIKTTKFYSLGLNMNDEAALMAYEVMSPNRKENI